MNEKKKNGWLLWVLLVLLPPIGIIYLWAAKKELAAKKKIILTIVFALWFIVCIAFGNSGDGLEQVNQTPVETETSVPSDVPAETEDVVAPIESSEPEVEPNVVEEEPEEEDEAADLTMGQKNALATAADYLSYTSFSYTGLINQLEFEQFSTEDATYAADNCGADWNEQAAKKAQEYLDFQSFSRDSLIDQLKFEGFTSEQAEYAADAVGY